jgi:hypothetical protein
MRVLIAHDDQQLRRLEASLAALKSRSTAEQLRMSFLIGALEREIGALEREKADVMATGVGLAG